MYKKILHFTFFTRNGPHHSMNLYNRNSLKLCSSSNLLNFERLKSEGQQIDRLPDSVQILKPAHQASSTAALKIKNISKAMKAYLERARNHESFLQVKNAEFEIGKRHLANIMGLDADTLTQEDIDKAIEYLLPSGLYEKKARPMMKPPEKMYPKEKAAQFDASGRPFSSFFYTRKSNYFEALHHLVEIFHELDSFEDKMIERGIQEPPKESHLTLQGSEWLTIDEMRDLFLEKISEIDYNFIITTLEKLAIHPYSFRCKEIFEKYRKEFIDVSTLESVPELMQDVDGRPYMEAIGYRKLCQAKVKVKGNGTGKISINGTDISFFYRVQDREQVMFPIEFCDLLEKVDIEVIVTGEGLSAQAGSIRHGISLCLRSFMTKEQIERMRLAGLLTRDRRRRGRKKPGQKGCRAKYTWKKR